jgi:tetratricopeptide (TPR) repeat protein
MTYETARRAFEQAVKADPSYAMAHASLARTYEELDYSDLAKESMLRAVGVAQDSRRLEGEEALKLRALQFLVARDYDRATPLFRDLERSAPAAEKAAAALESGWLAQLRDDTDGAAAGYERALKINPGYAAAKLRLGFIYGRRRMLDAALQAFQEAEGLYSAASDQEGVTETLYERARLLNRSSRSEEALPVIEKALAIAFAVGNPYQQISLQLTQGVAVRNLGDPERAAAIARRAIDSAAAQKMDNLATNGLIDLGNSFLMAGDIHAAEPVLRRALELAGRGKVRHNESRARLSLGSLCEQDRRPNEARQFVETALPFLRQSGYRREFVQAMAVLGGAHRELAEFDRAGNVLGEALAAAVQLHDRQTEANIRVRQAENLRDQGDWPAAVEEFSRAAAMLGIGGTEARLSCAVLYSRLGRRTEAEQTMSEAAELLRRMPNRQLLYELKISRAGMAYQDGRMSDARNLLGDILTGAPEEKQAAANLLAALVRIRTGELESTTALLESIDRDGLPLDSASARLAIAEALAAGNKPGLKAKQAALSLALKALEFLESHNITESVWHAHSVAARVSTEQEGAEAHRAAARAALARLSTLWTPAGMTGYLKRPDIAALAARLK